MSGYKPPSLEKTVNKLALGTVQFGLDYGISNKFGKIIIGEGSKIISTARNSGINTLDTAIAYGSSEQVLGKIGVEDFKIVTKLPPLPKDLGDVEGWVRNQIKESCLRLKVPTLYAVLLHRSEDLFGRFGPLLMRSLRRLKYDGIVKKFGVSIYDPEELAKVTKLMDFGLIQAPLNLIDRRMVTSGWFLRLKEEGVEIHTRSTFLQGLLLMERRDIPAKFERWSSVWDQWHKKLADSDTNALSACIAYPLSLPEVDRVIVGCDSAKQLKEICVAAKEVDLPFESSSMALTDIQLINPYHWSKL